MRQLTFIEPGVVRWQDADPPELTDQEAVLVRPLAVARCDLDLAMAGRQHRRRPTVSPLRTTAMGHRVFS